MFLKINKSKNITFPLVGRALYGVSSANHKDINAKFNAASIMVTMGCFSVHLRGSVFVCVYVCVFVTVSN